MRLLLTDLLLLPLVVLAAARSAWLYPRLPLDELIRRLGSVAPLPRPLRRPGAYRHAVNRWLRWLPPRGLRSCLRRSLILVDLWSRCGVVVEFHLGVRAGRPGDGGHAWVTAAGTPPDDAGAFRHVRTFTLTTALEGCGGR